MKLIIDTNIFDVEPIPEFPSWTPMMITLIAVVAMTAIYRQKLSKSNKKGDNQ